MTGPALWPAHHPRRVTSDAPRFFCCHCLRLALESRVGDLSAKHKPLPVVTIMPAEWNFSVVSVVHPGCQTCLSDTCLKTNSVLAQLPMLKSNERATIARKEPLRAHHHRRKGFTDEKIIVAWCDFLGRGRGRERPGANDE